MNDNVIYYDITKSPYVFSTSFFDFYFSSQFYLNKFKREVYNYVDTEQNKIKVKLGQDVNFIKIFMLDYYKKVEKRGFMVYDKEFNFYINKDYKIKGVIYYD